VFFRWYGSWFRQELEVFRHLFLQNNASSDLLKKIGISNTSVTGDTRFDRVMSTAGGVWKIDIAHEFSRQSMCIVAGSTWPADESLLARYINHAPSMVKFIIVPHEIKPVHIKRLVNRILKEHVLYSEATVDNITGKQVLIIDNVGMLSSLYQYGQIAYIGGGFGRGIHNILEAAVFGNPVIFGRNYSKSREAIEMIASGGAFAVDSFEDLQAITDKLISMHGVRENASSRARNYIVSNTGATRQIVQYLKSDLQLSKKI
jgi:3-deoxy-D-manno-octulosonic-acid transferase